MLGSPNFVLGVYNGSNASAPAPASVPAQPVASNVSANGSSAVGGAAGADDELRPWAWNNDGNAFLRRLFVQWFDDRGIDYELADFNGRSDYGPFLAAGIAAGGLDSGAEKIKSAAQRRRFGGLANAAFDPCYHQACDTLDNVHRGCLQTLSSAAAHVLQRLAEEPGLREGLAGAR